MRHNASYIAAGRSDNRPNGLKTRPTPPIS
jgi:hypothetical protein